MTELSIAQCGWSISDVCRAHSYLNDGDSRRLIAVCLLWETRIIVDHLLRSMSEGNSHTMTSAEVVKTFYSGLSRTLQLFRSVYGRGYGGSDDMAL